MIREELREKEPIVYRILENSLKSKKIAHSYLLSGEVNPLKLEAAYLMAQSIIEGKDDFACETCDICRRIRSNNYFDVCYIDGYETSIKEEVMSEVMDRFSLTALENSGKRIYIVSNLNNASVKVLNMILKFMEEPKDNIYGIFITDNKDSLLETIVSRCEELRFMARDFSFVEKEYEEKGYDPSDARLLADIFHQYRDDFDLEIYRSAKDYVYNTIDCLKEKKRLPVLFYKEFYPAFSSRDDLIAGTDFFLKIFRRMLEDALTSQKTDDQEYMSKLKELSKEDAGKLLEIVNDALDKTNASVDRRLLFDQIAYEIIS